MSSRGADRPPARPVIVLLCGGLVVTSWPLPDAGGVDMNLVEGLARLSLTARRLGCRIRLLKLGPQLSELLVLSGLAEIVAAHPLDRPDGPSGPGRLDPG
jgi:hypothetical protein